MSTVRGARQLLKDLQLAGLTHVLHCEPPVVAVAVPEVGEADREPQKNVLRTRDAEGESGERNSFRQAFADKKKKNTPVASSFPQGPASSPVVQRITVVPPNLVENTASLEERSRTLQVLANEVSQCVRCTLLATTRTQTVFGVGNPRAKIMFIGEAPGADEDRLGVPFIGKAGQLLDDIIRACKWSREDLYLCNILRCRPPENRTPNDQEAGNCRGFLDQQIATVDPQYIVCWGSCAAQNLLGTKEAIGKMRQKFYQFGRAKVLCTYHPAYLLRNAAAKKPVWEDMKLLMSQISQDEAAV